MRVTTLLNFLLNLQGLRVTGVRFKDGMMVISVHRKFRLLTCPLCGRRKRGRESKRVRRWRRMSIWGNEVWLEGEIRRLKCKKCAAVVTEAVPWARHDSDFTVPFEDAVALLARQTNKTAVMNLTGISWVTVGKIAERVVAEKLDPERLKSLRRIGVDEISFRKRYRYLTVVTDHDSGRVIWVAEGKNSVTVRRHKPPVLCASHRHKPGRRVALPAARSRIDRALPDRARAPRHVPRADRYRP